MSSTRARAALPRWRDWILRAAAASSGSSRSGRSLAAPLAGAGGGGGGAAAGTGTPRSSRMPSTRFRAWRPRAADWMRSAAAAASSSLTVSKMEACRAFCGWMGEGRTAHCGSAPRAGHSAGDGVGRLMSRVARKRVRILLMISTAQHYSRVRELLLFKQRLELATALSARSHAAVGDS